jgi:NADPH-dependent curcumin reductase CurA
MTYPATQREWRLAARPIGRALQDTDFELREGAVRAPADGEVLLKTLYFSFDPAQKSWLEVESGGYHGQTDIGGVIPGFGLGRVLESRDARFAAGDLVMGEIGWSEYPTLSADTVEAVPHGVAPEAALSILGITGRTAYLGLMNVGKPKAGDTLVVSGAAGATGSLVGQIGKIAGCRVIGIAGGAEKCAWLTETLGFDAAIDYRADKVSRKLRELAPAGVDVFFDNVGGEILDATLARMSVGARVVICGAISRYNFDPRSPEMPAGPRNYFNVVFTGATIQGFLMSHHERDYGVADRRLAAWLREGRIQVRADVLSGFENAPTALRRLFEGLNVGKQMLKVADA